MTNKLWKQFIDEDESGMPDVSKAGGFSRRTFLELLGYTTAGLTLASCRAPEQKVIPFVHQPPEMTPGVASWYASTCSGCSAGCGVLVKVRDGRPIKVEGNPENPINKGGLCPVAHSLVFGLYDSERLQGPRIGQSAAEWTQVDMQVADKLASVKATGGKVRFLSRTITGPASKAAIDKFLAQFPGSKHIVYEPVSFSAIADAHEKTHGVRAVPNYDLTKAKIIVNFGADFLGGWISPAQFARDYSAARDLKDEKKEMLRHIQFESRYSMTGANADTRVKISPNEEAEAILLLAKLTGQGSAAFEPSHLSPATKAAVEKYAAELQKAKGGSLVLCGSNDADIQQVVNSINQSLGNYGTTVRIDRPSMLGQNRDDEMKALVDEMAGGGVAALFILNANPAYDYFAASEFKNALAKVPFKVTFNPMLDETASLADVVCPTHHFLEAWDEVESVSGIFSMNQPVISPLFKTRAYQESLMAWSGDNRTFYDALRARWQTDLFPKQKKYTTFDEFWDHSIQDGVFVPEETAPAPPAYKADSVSEAFSRIAARKGQAGELTLALYEKITLRDGRFGGNPWLHEIPDPMSKTTWDNYACVSPKTAESKGLYEGQVVRLKKDSASVELPVLIQKGQSDDVVAVAVGYGRTMAGKAGTGVGGNAYPFVSLAGASFAYSSSGVTLEPTANSIALAKTQTEDSTHDRPLVEQFSFAEYLEGKAVEHGHEGQQLWPRHEYPDHKWGMVIDLSACIGCNACVLSCQAENNIPVVGKDEVRRRREMHWMRIDRYYEEKDGETKTLFQPITCQQCGNASCESVCPVLATAHSSEGLSMQVYNRCVGTRYCNNNCAFKVRRFNWFDYKHEDRLANLALNPDVTVRTRGVMEKCSFCIQRIEEVKIHSRNEGRPIKDGEIQTACQQSCPANAISFGDEKDLASRVVNLKKLGRNYVLLEELNLNPALTYLAKVRNSDTEGEA